jgi:hypothetical protein
MSTAAIFGLVIGGLSLLVLVPLGVWAICTLNRWDGKFR